MLLAAALGLGWLVATESGGRFLAARVTEWSGRTLFLAGWQGRLIGGFQLEEMRLERPDLYVQARGLRVDWQPWALQQKVLAIGVLSAEQLEIRTPASSEPPQLPTSLALPLGMHVDALAVETLHYGTLVPGAARQLPPELVLRRIRARVSSVGDAHLIDGMAMETPYGALSGTVKLATQAPFPLSIQLRLTGAVEDYRAELALTATGTLADVRARIEARSGMAHSPRLAGQADLQLQPFAALPVREARVRIQGLDPAAFHPQAPRALLQVDANLAPSQTRDPAGAQAWQVSGPLSIVNQQVRPLEDGLPVEALRAQLSWSADQLQLSQLVLALRGGGRASGDLAWQRVSNARAGRAQAALRLTGLDPAQLSRRARTMRIGGVIQAEGDEAEQRFRVDLDAGRLALRAQGAHRGTELAIEQARLQVGDAESRFAGKLALGASRAFSVQGTLERLDPHAFLADVPEASLNASFSAEGALEPAPHGLFRLVLAPSRFAGYPLAGRASARLTAQRLSEADIDLAVFGNTLTATGAFGAPDDKLALSLAAPHLDRFGHGLNGELSAQAVLQGTLEAPGGDLSLQARRLGYAGWRLGRADLSAQLQPGEAGNVALKARLQTLAQSDAVEARTWLEQMTLDLAGTRREHKLELDATAPEDTRLRATLAGGLAGASWQGRLLGLGLSGPLGLVLEKPATLELAADRIRLGEARLLPAQTGQGRIELLQTEWTPERLLARGRLSGLQLGLSLDEFQRTVFGGRSLQLGADWDLALAEAPRGIVHVYREGGDFVLQGDAPVALGLENLDVNLAIDEGRLAISALANGSRLGAFNAVATLALKGRGGNTRVDMGAPLVGVVNANMPSISWLGPLTNQNLRTAGSLQGQFNITGTPEKPVGAGFVKGEGLGLALNEQGLRLDRGTMAVSFDANRVRLDNLQFHADNRMAAPDGRLPRQPADGKVSGTGEIALPSGKGQFSASLDHVAVLQQPGQWLMLSGDAKLASGWDQLDIAARLRSDAGFIGVARGGAPKLSEDVVIRGRQKPPQRLRLNAEVNFDFGEAFILKAYGIDTWLDGTLQIRLAQGSVPRATGSIRARDGVFNAYGQRLEIERGAVNFHGPLDDPALNIVALRKGLEVEAGVEVTGSAQRPKVRLVSQPSVPEQEKLAWILFGRPSEGNAADIGVLLSAAGANMGADGEGLGSRIASGFGLDSIGVASSTNGARRGLQSSVANNATSGNATPGASNASGSSAGETMSNQVLSLGKRLSNRAYLSFEQNFLGTESVVKLSYALTRAISVIARAGTDNALDLNYSLSFR